MQKRGILASVQVLPDALGRMVVDRPKLPTLGTGKAGAFGMLDMDIHPASLNVQINPPNEPGRPQTQQMLVKLRVLHRRIPPMRTSRSTRRMNQGARKPNRCW